MKAKLKERPEEKAVEQCHHYWVIEVANGPTSQGRCKHCGASKEFLNAFPEFNPMRRSSNPLSLPKISDVELDEKSKS